MSKTVTLRLKNEIYNIFLEMAKAENRSLFNLIETAALNKMYVFRGCATPFHSDVYVSGHFNNLAVREPRSPPLLSY